MLAVDAGLNDLVEQRQAGAKEVGTLHGLVSLDDLSGALAIVEVDGQEYPAAHLMHPPTVAVQALQSLGVVVTTATSLTSCIRAMNFFTGVCWVQTKMGF